jgi:membrane associated rhomboid family serine protease
MYQNVLIGVVTFTGVIWCVFIVSRFVPSLNRYGVVPRTSAGLVGILTMPFLHYDLTHILSNTVPLFILLVLLAASRARPWVPVVGIVLLGGFLLWLVGRRRIHIGASGLIFGLISFLIICGIREGQLVSLAAR